jgi:hypothetical protein
VNTPPTDAANALDVTGSDRGVSETSLPDGGVGDVVVGDAIVLADGSVADGDVADAIAPADGGGRDGTIIFVGDFEVPGDFVPGGTYPQFSTNIDTCEHDMMCTTNSLEIVTNLARGGAHSVRITLRNTDVQSTSGTRAELQNGSFYTTALEQDYWYGWSIYVPSDWELLAGQMSVVHQWHTGGGNPGPSPIIALRIRDTNWQITRELVDGGGTIPLWSGAVTRGVWTDWVMHIRWSTGATGRFETWQNGASVYSETGQNLATGTTTSGHYEKFGLYGTLVAPITERVLYYDEIRVATGPDAYGLVAP